MELLVMAAFVLLHLKCFPPSLWCSEFFCCCVYAHYFTSMVVSCLNHMKKSDHSTLHESEARPLKKDQYTMWLNPDAFLCRCLNLTFFFFQIKAVASNFYYLCFYFKDKWTLWSFISKVANIENCISVVLGLDVEKIL